MEIQRLFGETGAGDLLEDLPRHFHEVLAQRSRKLAAFIGRGNVTLDENRAIVRPECGGAAPTVTKPNLLPRASSPFSNLLHALALTFLSYGLINAQGDTLSLSPVIVPTFNAVDPVEFNPFANDPSLAGSSGQITGIVDPRGGSLATDPNQSLNLIFTPAASFKSLFAKRIPVEGGFFFQDNSGNIGQASITVKSAYVIANGSYAGFINTQSHQFIRISLSSSGAFTGTLYDGLDVIPFHGSFGTDASANVAIRGQSGALQLDLALLANYSPTTLAQAQSTGSFNLTGTYNGTQFSIQHVPQFSPPSHSEVFLPAVSTSDATTPAGTSIISFGPTKTGFTPAIIKLADGTSLSASFAINENSDGSFTYLVNSLLHYRKVGLLSGSFTSDSSDTSAITQGSLNWIKPDQTSGTFYSSGFNTALSTAGGAYVPPARSSFSLSYTSPTRAATVTFGAPDFPTAVTATVAIKPGKVAGTEMATVTGSNPNKVTVTIIRATGAITGTFINPVTKKATAFHGEVDQSTNSGAGYFITPTQSGYFSLQPE